MKRAFGAGVLAAASLSVSAQEDAVVVTATRMPRPSMEVPASVDRLYADEIRQGRPQVGAIYRISYSPPKAPAKK